MEQVTEIKHDEINKRNFQQKWIDYKKKKTRSTIKK